MRQHDLVAFKKGLKNPPRHGDEQADVRAQDATRFSDGPFDLVLLDPPYGSGLGQGALAQLMRSGAIAPGCFVSLETARDESIAIPDLAMVADRTYGRARIRLLRPG